MKSLEILGMLRLPLSGGAMGEAVDQRWLHHRHQGAALFPFWGPLQGGGALVGGPRGKGRSAHKTMISIKFHLKILTRKFALEPRVGFRVRASDSMHQDDSGKHPGRVLGGPK